MQCSQVDLHEQHHVAPTDTLVAVEMKMESGIGRLHTPPQLRARLTRVDAVYFYESIHDLIDEFFPEGTS